MSRPPPQSGYLPGQSSVLADLLSCRDQVVGPAWSFHPPVAPAFLRAWGFPSLDLFATGLPAVLPLFCSLVPNPRVVFLDAFRVHWDALGMYSFHPSYRRMGGGSSRRGPILSRTLVSPSDWVGVVRGPSPPILVVFRVLFRRGKVCHSRQFQALSRPLTLSWPFRTWFARSIMDISVFLANFSELRSPPGVVTLVPQGLARGLYVPFGLWLSVFLPSHCSSSWPLPRLESPAYFTSFVSSLSLQS